MKNFCVFIIVLCSFFVSPSNRESSPTWKLCSKHFIYGMPVPIDDRYNFVPANMKGEVAGISVLVREGFVVGHCDRFKAPLWVAMKWTQDDFRRSEQEPGKKSIFKRDGELPEYAQGDEDYKNQEFPLYEIKSAQDDPHQAHNMQRGHMARQEDNKAWGADTIDAGCLMSNIVPQHKYLNPIDWLELENAHRYIVDGVTRSQDGEVPGIDEIWIIAGAVYKNLDATMWVGNHIGVPHATYKIIAWFKPDRSLTARGYLFDQTRMISDPSLPASAFNKKAQDYLVKIQDIEDLTGLDFFPEMVDFLEESLENEEHLELWKD